MVGPPRREAYNAKGRQSTAGSRKKGKIKKNKSELPLDEPQINTNADILTPKTKEEKETERKQKLLQELAAQSESKWNSKKKKRLEKYIDKKLKKEERVLLFEKLSKSQASLSSTVLQSSATLGTGRAATHQELQDKAEDILVKRSLVGQAGKRKRHQDVYDIYDHNSDSEEEEELKETSEPQDQTKPIRPPVPASSSSRPLDVVDATTFDVSSTANRPLPVVGSALQRNVDGSVVAPKIRKRSKGKQSIQRGWGGIKPVKIEHESDSSFDSSDSENDSSDAMKGVDGSHSEGESSHSGGEGSSSGEEDMHSEAENDDTSTEELGSPPAKKQSFGFKEWAVQQLYAAKGFEPKRDGTPETTEATRASKPPKKKRKVNKGAGHTEFRGPLGEDLQLPSTSFATSFLGSGSKSEKTSYVKVVEVQRPQSVEEARVLLPIVTEEQPIMEAILLNPVIIICGETGSGKTTQVPQFLYEAGFGSPGSENPGMIGITQPRRVAAMSMASRVAHELSLTSSRVSYQIRYDATVSPSTSIKFMTDGVLLRELATDFLLTRYSVIIVDEAHERSINTDILIGVLSRVVKLLEEMWKSAKDRTKPLRLIIMSATLRVSDFSENATLFSAPPPVINVAARQHPVTIHFSRRTYPDYVTQAVKKTSKIHTKLPPGGILIFLTGQAEIAGVCRKLEAKFGKKALDQKKRRRNQLQGQSEFDDIDVSKAVNPAQAGIEAEDVDLGNAAEDSLAFDVDDEDMEGPEDPEALDTDEEEQLDEELGLDADSDLPMHIVPLYSLLPSEKQMLVFQPPPPDTRLVVVSTNVAETSLTIPGIRYVVDCGRAKERRYDIGNGIQSFHVSWISKASAAQRAGRAGRTGPGHCYRLYSSALFEYHFDKFATPEIRRMPIEGVVLQMKSMHIDAVVNFPFPTPPDRFSLQKAEKALAYLGALKPANPTGGSGEQGSQITDLGVAMSFFPLTPRFSRMLVSGQQHGCLPYVICIISALSVGDPFIYEDAIGQDNEEPKDEDLSALSGIQKEAIREKERRQLLRKAFFKSQHTHASLGNYTSDLFRLLSVVGAYEYAGGGQKFCSEHFVRPKAMEEIHKLRAQISTIVHTHFPNTDPGFTSHLAPPSAQQLKVLRQLLTGAFIDQVAVRKDVVDKIGSTGTQYSNSANVPYRALGIQEDVYVHPASLLASVTPPDYLVYHEIVRTSRVFLKGLTTINPLWLSALGKDTLCTFSKPVKNNVNVFMTIPRFGPEGWELPAIKASGIDHTK